MQNTEGYLTLLDARSQSNCYVLKIIPVEKLDNREWQSESTLVYNYHFTWTTKGVRCYSQL